LEHVIQQLLTEAGHHLVQHSMVAVAGQGIEAAADVNDINPPETYIGCERAQNFVSPGRAVQDAGHVCESAPQLDLNQWALTGNWTVQGESALLNQASGSIIYRFHAWDLHLVLGPGSDGRPVRFRVLIDGQPPLADYGVDTDEQGNGTVTEQRLYQLVR
jgi:hypothetical protein